MSGVRAEERSRVTDLVCEAPVVEGRSIRLGYAARAGDVTVHEFTETIELPGTLDGVPDAVQVPLLRLLSLAASLSYFKAFAPTSIAVPGGLTERERDFLVGLLRHGMGEFAYVNDLPEVFDTPVVAPSLADPAPVPAPEQASSRFLVAVGGGKDSIVSIEALRSAGLEIGLFAVNSYAPIIRTAEVAGIALETVQRRLDPTLFQLNAEGAPNGHVPVTAVNSLLAVLTAAALGFDTVVFSNEASSSYGNVEWHGRVVNHQWSKSLEFESLLRGCLPPGAPAYLSLLRPLTELRIARRFAEHVDYHPVFTSCNRAFKLQETDRTSWCADCPKCRFVFLCLAPFLSQEQLLAIFGGRDMFADESQLEGFRELLGLDGLLKPFECVGEPDECRVALSLLREHPDWKDHPFVHRPELVGVSASATEREAVFAFGEGAHHLPPLLEDIARAV
ncbi:hypothetical protein [Nocardioides conyzicola]|uniref:hypothetical protein n=1 Tax=Nocardioides conyzicola TaxID=1651781 RepID=UPI0031EAA8F6